MYCSYGIIVSQYYFTNCYSCGISGTEHTIISFMSEFIKLRDNYSVFAGDFHFNCQLSVVLQLHKISLCV